MSARICLFEVYRRNWSVLNRRLGGSMPVGGQSPYAGHPLQKIYFTPT